MGKGSAHISQIKQIYPGYQKTCDFGSQEAELSFKVKIYLDS